jgi:gliding motility-associated-like protein
MNLPSVQGLALLFCLSGMFLPGTLAAQDCPSAGTGASATVCSTVSPFQLANYLGGQPSPGGSWLDPLGASFPGLFNPGVHPSGNYTYFFAATPECPLVQAVVAISVQQPPNAGTSASTVVCSNQANFLMRPLLGPSAQPGGSWTGPDGLPHSSTYFPATDVSGIYTYTVSGNNICDDAVATLTVTRIVAPQAGGDGSLTLCSTSASVALVNSLIPPVDPGGSWTGPNGPHGGTFNPATDVAGLYTYTVPGTAPCTADVATVTVTVNQQPFAGTSTSITVCANQPSFSLFALLGNGAQEGGAWTGPGGGPVSGTYVPGSSTPGIYTYTVLGQPPCTASTATVTVTQIAPPNAGISNSITVCSIDPAFQLIAQLLGTPQPGGTWTGPDGPHGSTFIPGQHTAGTYTYTVVGQTPCANASASVIITVRAAPNAGVSASTTVCSNDPGFAMLPLLGPNAQLGGSWTAPGGAVHPGTFVPGSSTPGVYTYTVVGQSPCAPAVATVTVNVTSAPNAGVGTSVVRCSNDASFQLFGLLTNGAQAGGSWSGPSGAHSGLFVPGTDVAGTYTYMVQGQPPCADATAAITVSVVTAPHAGLSDDTLVCSNASQFDLIQVLDGNPSLNGTWTAPGGGPHSGLFIPGTSTPGIYTYTVPGQAPCANAQATVTVSVQAMPVPGTNGSITVCSNAPSVDLFSLLGGSPQPGGSWTRPNGTSHSGTYLPASQPGGNYTYTVQGIAPCPSASAVVQVNRVIAPRAGTDGTITVCSTNSSFQLFSVLGGSPDGNGSWINAQGVGVPGTFIPGTSSPGTYRYVVPGTIPCANDTAQVTVIVNQAPNAGTNGTLTVCSSDASFNLLGVLNNGPSTGGTWTDPTGVAHSGVFVPGTSLVGGYTYTVAGLTPCLNASAVAVVNENRQPVAGTDAAFTVCSTDPQVDLQGLLGTADSGGSWSGPGILNGSLFTPGSSTAGVYTYTVNGTLPCLNAQAQVTATVNTAPNAGTGGSITICQDVGVVDLTTGLSGSPDANGSWSDDNGTNQLSGHLFSPFGLPIGTYSFTYTVPGNGQCASDQTTVDVVIVGGLNAGTNGLLNVCRTNTQVNLFNGLNGNPQPGGIWIDLSNTGAQTGQFFNASFVPAGSYQFQYQLTGSVACASASAIVTVNVTDAPNAGTNGQAILCSNGASVLLFNYLGGNPATGGTWTVGGVTVSGTYNPVVHSPNVYTYTVAGSGPCANAQATVTVSEVTAPVAGIGTSLSVCCSDAAFDMFSLLTGGPQPGGVWSFNGQPHAPFFVPCLDLPGVYSYTVSGQAPCAASTASLTISVVQPPQSGLPSSQLICGNSMPFVLLSAMGGADFGGSWTAPDNTVLPATYIYTPGSSEPGAYVYTVNGTAPCGASSTILNVFENDAANAGGDIAVSFCSNGPNVDLLTVIPGDPDPNGFWIGPNQTPFNGTFIPGTSTPGTYLYVVEGVPPCVTDTATVVVSITPAPNAGISDVEIVCSNQAPFSMVQRLNGLPQLGGSWTGPLPATTSMDGIFFPGTTPAGTYVYTVQGNGVCPPATASLQVIVNLQPFAGCNTSLTLCSNSTAQNLFPLLCNAQPGGSWSGPSSINGTFNPAVHLPGLYTYTVQGIAPCTAHSATVNVQVNQAPNAGFNGLTTICETALPFTLLSQLNGSPMTTGTWTYGVNATPHNGIFLPGQDQGGVYNYTVSGLAPCLNATAQVTVIQNTQPDAGQNGVVQVCSDEPPFPLFDHLTGSPDPGGNWISPPPSGPFSGTFIPGSSNAGIYSYILPALAPCVSDTAQVTVIQNLAPNAGCNAVAQICSSTAPFPLIGLLGCAPAQNGFWTQGVNGPPRSPIFDPAVDGSGTYVYTVAGAPPCDNAVAQVQITLVNAPYAGLDGSIAACVDDPSIGLFPALGPSYTPGGTWNALSLQGVLTNGSFNSVGVPPGTYQFRYIVAALAPCASDTALVTVQISSALDAGEDNAVEVCGSQLLALFGALGGTPQAGGIWVDVDGSGALVGNVFNATVVPAGSTWRFDYILPASALCEGDSARVTVTVLESPYAGCNGSINVCSNGLPLVLANSLGCSPDGGGSWLAPGGLPHNGIFQPGTDVPGNYTYVVPAVGNCPSNSAIVVVGVQNAANAGEDAQVSICSTDSPVALFNLLGNEAQSGGTWWNVTLNSPFNGIYNPAIHSPALYRYTVTAQLPCANSVAFVTVTEPVAPNAGCNASINVCSNQAPLNLFNQLGCGPASGGTWTGPNGPHGSFFDPAIHPPGPYVYQIAGIAPCADTSATVFVVVTTASNPGTSTTLNACISQTAIDLFAALGQGADPGGTWTDVNTSNALTGGSFDPSAAGLGTWGFTYSFPSNGPCAASSSTITVIVTAGADPGLDSTLTICGGDTAYVLFDALGGEPDPGGTWIDLTGTGALQPGGILNAQLLAAGVTAQFGYQLIDPGCGTVSSLLTVTISEFTDPGGDGSLLVCSTAEPVDLFDLLTGTPDAGGSWITPQGDQHTGIFDPGTDLPGGYRYIIPATAFCPQGVAQVLVQVGQPPNAGTDGTLTACNSETDLPVFTGLGGSPQSGGSWQDLSGVGAAFIDGSLNTGLLEAGSYSFRYTVTSPGCAPDDAVVTVQVIEGVRMEDLVLTCNEQQRTYTATFTLHSGEPMSYAVSGIPGVLSGEGNLFTSEALPASQSYTVTVTDNSGCPGIEFEVVSPCTFTDDIFIPQTFSPNDDGINDRFVIPGIEGFPGNTVVIFNRWGNKIHESAGYDNRSVVWDGSSTSAMIQGKAPAGTYYYVIDLGNGSDAYTGYIYLNR